MDITLSLPPQTEQSYLAEARAKGVPLNALLVDVLVARQPSPDAVNLPAEEWVNEFRNWIRSHAGDNLPLLSDEAISREFIYQDRGL